MKKAGMLVAIVAAMVLALCLTGCGPRLDSEKTIGGMTYSVPSDWEEVPFSSDSEQLFLAKDGNSIDAFATAADSETPEDSLESWKESATIVSGHAEDWNSEKVSESVIDNVLCVVYEVSYKISASGKETAVSSQIAYLYKSDAHYTLVVTGDAVKMEDLLKTVSIS